MPAIGMALGWGGYTLALWGYCLLRGYNVTLGQLANPKNIGNWKTLTANQIPNTQVMPGNSPDATAAQVQQTTPNSGTPGTSSGSPGTLV
jgi:hypothetical protein